MDIGTLTADTILAIPLDAPQRLFPLDVQEAEFVWRELARTWHPDRAPHPKASAVFSHIGALKRHATQRRAAGRWETDVDLTLVDLDGRTHRWGCLRRHATELGETCVGPTTISLLTDARNHDLAEHACRTIDSLSFEDSEMREEMSSWLPSEVEHFETSTHHVLVLHKAPDMVLLSDLLAHEGDELDARHVGWIVSGMLHVACYLEWVGLAHNAIGPETWMVSPAHHSGALVGGWAYTAAAGTRLTAAPARTVDAAPTIWRRAKIATPTMDRELIKLTAREMLGTGPDPLAEWLTRPPMVRAADDYASWKSALREAFGRPRFTPLTTTPDDVYGDNPQGE